MLTFGNVIILFFLLWYCSRRPEFPILADYYLMAVLSCAVFMCVFNGVVIGWFMFARRFLF